MGIATIRLNRTGNGFHIRGDPGSPSADFLEETLQLLRDYGAPEDPEEASHTYHLQFDKEQVDAIKKKGRGKVQGKLYDVDALRLDHDGEHSRVVGDRPFANMTLLLKTSERTDYGSLRDADYAVRGAIVATPLVVGFVDKCTRKGQDDTLRTGQLEAEIVNYGRRRLGL